MSHTARSPTKKSSRIAAKNKAPAADDAVSPNATPRPVRTKRHPAPALSSSVPAMHFAIRGEAAMPVLTCDASTSGPDSSREDMERGTSSVTESTGSKARSRSPTQRMADLRVAEKTVVTKTVESPVYVPEDVRALLNAIESLALVPRGVIPLGIEDEVKKDAGRDLDDLELLVATTTTGRSREELVDQFKALRGVRDATRFCKTRHVDEPTWNERVHSRMLEQAVHGRPALEYHNITTARVINQLVPRNKYGELLEYKMIDYAITLGPPLFLEDDVVTRLAASRLPLQRSINPTDYSPLCHSPVAISIQSKPPDGGKESGEVQLSICAMAYFNRLPMLTQDPVGITLPLVLVSDEHWKLLFARDREHSIEIIDAVDFGDTGNIIGCYRILAVLRLLCKWAEETFLGWFVDKVLKPE